VVILAQIDFYLADQSGVMKMTTILPPPLGSQLSPGNQMNDTPAESGSRQRDLELQQLVLAIKNSPNQQDRETRKQIDRFLRKVIDRLKPAQRKLISGWQGLADVESIVAEAVNNTILQVVINIDSYNPERSGVMTWINMILNSRFLDLVEKYRPRHESISLDNPNGSAESEVQEKIDKDDAIVDDLETDYMARKLWEFIMEDPDGHFTENHIRNYPDATLKKILLMRLNRLKWQEIANRFNISSHATINNFHDKQVRELKKYFRKNLC
jgi:DNA-directed RNA polymerase specialized sigma24 family protein